MLVACLFSPRDSSESTELTHLYEHAVWTEKLQLRLDVSTKCGRNVFLMPLLDMFVIGMFWHSLGGCVIRFVVLDTSEFFCYHVGFDFW